MTNTFILQLGQSNALGYLNDGPAPYTPTARVQIWVPDPAPGAPDGQWEYMRPGVNTGSAGDPHAWGPEVGEANAFMASHPDSSEMLWFYKLAPGSTALDASGVNTASGRTWSPEVAGNVYDRAVAGAAHAMAVLEPTPYAFTHWDGLMWSQGETDATEAGMAARYGANLTDFLAHARADMHVSDVVISRIDNGPGAGAYNFDVRLAEWQEAQQPHTAGFSTIGYGLAADGLHYDAAGQLQLGASLWSSLEGIA